MVCVAVLPVPPTVVLPKSVLWMLTSTGPLTTRSGSEIVQVTVSPSLSAKCVGLNTGRLHVTAPIVVAATDCALPDPRDSVALNAKPAASTAARPRVTATFRLKYVISDPFLVIGQRLVL